MNPLDLIGWALSLGVSLAIVVGAVFGVTIGIRYVIGLTSKANWFKKQYNIIDPSQDLRMDQLPLPAAFVLEFPCGGSYIFYGRIDLCLIMQEKKDHTAALATP